MKCICIISAANAELPAVLQQQNNFHQLAFVSVKISYHPSEGSSRAILGEYSIAFDSIVLEERD